MFVFPMAVSLAQGKGLALAHWLMGTLYACLDESLRNVIRLVRRYNVVSYVDAYFLQLSMGAIQDAFS